MAMPLPMFPMRALTIDGSLVGSLRRDRGDDGVGARGKVDPIPVQTRPLSDANKTLDDLREGKITGRVVLTP